MEPREALSEAPEATFQVIYAIDANYRLQRYNTSWTACARARGVPEWAEPAPGAVSVLGAMTGGRIDHFLEVYERIWTGRLDVYREVAAGGPGEGGYELAIARRGGALVHVVTPLGGPRRGPG
ncbi:MAG: hypothetical protein K8I02_09800 [Candidatus Methylomirabilis sp.]|nr:hypothetical protein [Deltaproteobacteria bacterium]